MANVVVISDTEQFLAEYDKVRAADDMFIVYLTGSVNEETGKSWCPDCDVARPNITEHVLGKTGLKVLKGVVEERNSWVGVKTHPYKVHPIIKAGGVPCVLLAQKDQILMRAEDEKDFENLDLLGEIANP